MTVGHYSFLLPHSLLVRGARSCRLLLCRTSQQSIPVLIISNLITVSQLPTSWSLRHENSLSSGLALYCHSHNKWLGTQHKLKRCQILRHSWYLWKTNPPTIALITALPWAQNSSTPPPTFRGSTIWTWRARRKNYLLLFSSFNHIHILTYSSKHGRGPLQNSNRFGKNTLCTYK